MIRGPLWDLLDDAALEQMHAAALRLLAESGARVEHEATLAALAARGCAVDATRQHCRFPRALVEEACAHFARLEAEQRRARGGADPAQFLRPTGWTPSPAGRLGTGGNYPHLLHWPSGERRLATRADVVALAQMAHVLPEFRTVGQALITPEVDPRCEPVWNTATRLGLTTKPLGGSEVVYAENVKHLVRLGEIATGRAGCTDLVASCNFCISPLRFTRRMLLNVVEKARFGISSVMGSMPISGLSGPVTLAGTAALMLAETLAGWTIAYVLAPHLPVGMIVASGSLDMRTTQALFGSPEAKLQDLAVIHCCRRRVGIAAVWCAFGYVDCKTPGLRAVYEKLLPLAAIPLVGSQIFHASGLLSAGQDYSPVQHLLELDFQRGLERFLGAFAVTPETLAVDLQMATLAQASPNFLASEHTLRHYAAEQYYPQWLDRTAWRGTAVEVEEERGMLERIDGYWRAAVARYEPVELDAAKRRAIAEVLAAAEREAPQVELVM